MDTTSDSVPPGFSRSLPGCLESCCEALSSERMWQQSRCGYLSETRLGPLTFLFELWRAYKVQLPYMRSFSHPRISGRWTVVGVGLTLLSVIAAHIYPGNNPGSKQAGLWEGWFLWSGCLWLLRLCSDVSRSLSLLLSCASHHIILFYFKILALLDR